MQSTTKREKHSKWTDKPVLLFHLCERPPHGLFDHGFPLRGAPNGLVKRAEHGIALPGNSMGLHNHKESGECVGPKGMEDPRDILHRQGKHRVPDTEPLWAYHKTTSTRPVQSS